MKSRVGSLAVVLAGSLFLGGAASPQDDGAWQEAYGKLVQAKRKRAKDPKTYVTAILEFGDSTYSKRDEQTAKILFALLLEELKDDTADGRREDRIDGLVVEACEEALTRVTSQESVEYLINASRSPGFGIRVRFSLCRVLGAFRGEALQVLVEMLEERDPRIQIGATDGLRELLRAEPGKKVDELFLQATSGSDRASRILSVGRNALEEDPAALFKRRCNELPFLLEGVIAGFAKKERVVASMQELRAIAEGIAGEEPKKRVVALVASFIDFVDPFLKDVDELNAIRETVEPAMTALLSVVADPDRSWEVRIGALQALRADRHVDQVEPLIEALGATGSADGRLKVDLMQALGAILGVRDPRTDDPNWWRSALAERQAGARPGESGGTTATPTEFFGLKTKSTRIVFILDRTGSMDTRCTFEVPRRSDPAKEGADAVTDEEELNSQEEIAKRKSGEIRKLWEDREIETRMDALKREFINTIYHLDPRVQFAVVWYEAHPQNWKPALVEANWFNKLDCIHEIDGLSPSGPTNVWDGLESGYRFIAKPQRPEVIRFTRKGNYVTMVNGADTFFLMTDGNHNTGRFSIQPSAWGDFDERAFLAEFTKVNTIRKVVVNTVILGDTTRTVENQDPIQQKSLSLFRSISKFSGGSFVHLGE